MGRMDRERRKFSQKRNLVVAVVFPLCFSSPKQGTHFIRTSPKCQAGTTATIGLALLMDEYLYRTTVWYVAFGI